MSDFFETPENETGYSRLDSMNEQRARRRRRLIMLSIALVVVVVLAIGAALAYRVVSSRGGAPSTRAAKPITATSPESRAADTTTPAESAEDSSTLLPKHVMNVLVVGVHEGSGRKAAKGMLFGKIDLVSNSIQAFNVPERTYVEIPSLGLGQVSESYGMGLDTAKKTIEGIFHVPADDHIVLRYEDFEFLVSDKRFQDALGKALETSLPAADKGLYAKALSKIDPAKVNVTPLPVKFMSLNGEPYYEPNGEEISRLVASLWGIKVEVKSRPARVIVLNGSGQPGVGKAVSDKISPNGFLVIDTKNASSFNYQRTEIVAYRQEFIEKAKAIKQILGVGNVTYHKVDQDVAEIAVIIGKDFKVTR